MMIKINKDFLTEYKDDAWKGFSVRELLCLIGAVGVGISVDALLHYFAGLSLAAGVYVALPLALPIILIGFYKYQGFLTVGKFISQWWYTLKNSRLTYNSGECVEMERRYRTEGISENNSRITLKTKE